MRYVILDTETTGLNWRQGHCIVEIGAVELLGRQLTGRQYHTYLKPDEKCEFDSEAQKITGLTKEKLADKPPFADIVDDFLAFIDGAEILIHNAPFDVGFINAELQRLDNKKKDYGQLADYATIQDTLLLAQAIYPGQRNSLDALCKRLGIDLAQRQLHGALLDAKLLAQVYLSLTSGQNELCLKPASRDQQPDGEALGMAFADHDAQQRPLVQPSPSEQAAHNAFLQRLRETSGRAIWDLTSSD